MIARVILPLAVLATLAGTAGNAEAVCQNSGTDSYRRLLVGQQPDLFFTAGTPSSQDIPVAFVTYSAVGIPIQYNDCGATAVSSIPGVSVEGTYCVWDPPGYCWIGPSAPVDKSQPDSGSLPAGFYRHYEQNHLRPIRVFYDGTAAAGTVGRIDIATVDEFGNPIIILGSVNIHIVSGAPAPTWFTVTSKRNAISGDSLILDNPHINIQPAARIFAMHYGYKRHWNHPIAVTYDTWLGKWKIRNEDGEPMPVGLSFHVRIDPSAKVITTPRDVGTNSLTIDDPVANYNPFATIVVTPWSSGNRRMTQPFAVQYIAPYWRIVFPNGTPMPVSDYNAIPYNTAGFFVEIIGASTYRDDLSSWDASGFRYTSKSNGAGVDVRATNRTSGDTRSLSFFCWASSTFTPVIATLNMTPLPYPAPHNYGVFYESQFYGASFTGNAATIYHEDGSPMADTAPFNVMAPYRPSCAWPNQ